MSTIDTFSGVLGEAAPEIKLKDATCDSILKSGSPLAPEALYPKSCKNPTKPGPACSDLSCVRKVGYSWDGPLPPRFSSRLGHLMALGPKS